MTNMAISGRWNKIVTYGRYGHLRAVAHIYIRFGMVISGRWHTFIYGRYGHLRAVAHIYIW